MKRPRPHQHTTLSHSRIGARDAPAWGRPTLACTPHSFLMAPSRGRGQRGPPVEPDEPPADAAPPPTPFSALVRDVLLHALSLCDGDTGADLVRLAAVDRGTRTLLHAGDDYFADVARAAWGVRERAPVDVHGRPVGTFKESVASHERVLGSLGGHGRAAARAWHRLRSVLPPAVRATLSPPLADDVLGRFRRCGWHESVIAYAAVCDGQVSGAEKVGGMRSEASWSCFRTF